MDFSFDIGTFLAAVCAAGAGLAGFNSWKFETLGRKRIDIAEKSIVLLAQTVEAIESNRLIRMMPDDEMESDPGFLKVFSETALANLKTVKGTVEQLNEIRYLFCAHFGPDYMASFVNVSVAYQMITNALQYNIQGEPNRALNEAYLIKAAENDPLTQSLSDGIDAIYLKTYEELQVIGKNALFDMRGGVFAMMGRLLFGTKPLKMMRKFGKKLKRHHA